MKVSFSLANSKATKTSKPVGEAPSLKRPITFASLEDDDSVDTVLTASSSTKAPANKQLIAQNVEMSKAMKRQIEEEKKVDATVFEYDEVWDKMQEAKQRQKEVKEIESKERKVSSPIRCARSRLTVECTVAQIHPRSPHFSCNAQT
jgi:coiled-coil domain-containing protein 55